MRVAVATGERTWCPKRALARGPRLGRRGSNERRASFDRRPFTSPGGGNGKSGAGDGAPPGMGAMSMAVRLTR
jgi:hypothetical protein